jgi:ketosteroid isomerase-like protein
MSTSDRQSTEDLVRRYYALVSDLTSAEQELTALIHPQAEFVEMPNRLVPEGRTTSAVQSVEGLRAGRALLSDQRFDVHDVVVDGNRAAVRATWWGRIRLDRGPFRAGQELRAHVSAWLTLKDGQIYRHDTYDCYEPFPPHPEDQVRL